MIVAGKAPICEGIASIMQHAASTPVASPPGVLHHPDSDSHLGHIRMLVERCQLWCSHSPSGNCLHSFQVVYIKHAIVQISAASKKEKRHSVGDKATSQQQTCRKFTSICITNTGTHLGGAIFLPS